MSNLVIRTLAREELPFLLEMITGEGWNPGLYDGQCFLAADPQGFLLGLLNGVPVACISGVQYTNNFAFLGCYVVRPEYRGAGYGLQLFHAIRARLADLGVTTMAADGVLAMVPKYLQAGFTKAYGNIRHEGEAGGSMPGDARVQPLTEAPFEALADLDAEHFGARREAFLRCWVDASHGEGLAWVEDGRLTGYGVVRPCVRGWKIGPLFAPHPEAAALLFQGLAAQARSGPLYLDTPAPNAAALALAARHGLKPVFETARIHMGPPQQLPLERIYGVTTFELG
ncbi:GNAT family N-acetyltransferase [Megalodesulfovibrio paquesii]